MKEWHLFALPAVAGAVGLPLGGVWGSVIGIVVGFFVQFVGPWICGSRLKFAAQAPMPTLEVDLEVGAPEDQDGSP
jgi:hypothetical protein